MFCCPWSSFAACACTAATTRGCACPVFVTPMPDVKSRYRMPSGVTSHEPSPWSTTRFVIRVHTGGTTERSGRGAADVAPGTGAVSTMSGSPWPPRAPGRCRDADGDGAMLAEAGNAARAERRDQHQPDRAQEHHAADDV